MAAQDRGRALQHVRLPALDIGLDEAQAVQATRLGEAVEGLDLDGFAQDGPSLSDGTAVWAEVALCSRRTVQTLRRIERA